MNRRTGNSIRNIVYGMGAKIIAMIFPFIVRTLIIRRMGIEYGGLNSLFSSILNFLTLTELGFGSTLVFSMYKPTADNDIDQMCRLLNFYKKVYNIVAVVIIIIGLMIIPFLPLLVQGNVPDNINLYTLYLVYLSNTALSYFLFAYRSSLFVAYQRTDIQSKVMLLAYSIMAIAQIGSIVVIKNYYLYAASNILFTVLQNMMVYFISKKYYPMIVCRGNISKNEIKELFKKTIALAGHKVGGTVVSSLDSIVISSILGLTAVGMYGNYYTVLAALMAFIGVYNNAILPSIGNYLIKEESDRKYLLFINLNFVHVWIVGWATVCLLILFPDFIDLWIGKQYAFSSIQTILVCIYFYSWQFRVLSSNFKDAAGLWTEDALKPYIATGVNVVLNIFLVKKIGISGALISTIICMFFIFFPWETHVLFKKLFIRSKKEFLLKEIFWLCLWLVISVLTFYISKIITCNSIILRLILKGTLCLFLPNILYCLVFFKTKEFNYIRNKIRGGLRATKN